MQNLLKLYSEIYDENYLTKQNSSLRNAKNVGFFNHRNERNMKKTSPNRNIMKVKFIISTYFVSWVDTVGSADSVGGRNDGAPAKMRVSSL